MKMGRKRGTHAVADAGSVAVAEAEGLPAVGRQRLRCLYGVLVGHTQLAVRVGACGEGREGETLRHMAGGELEGGTSRRFR
jgi:hypothetical protein